jgi:uncharacterized membrane protein
MEKSKKINRLALISFISGLIGHVSMGLNFLLYHINEPSGIILNLTDGILIPLRNLSVAVAVVTGMMALIDIKNKDNAERGKRLAWLGILLGAVLFLAGIFVGLAFLVGTLLG